MRAPRRTLAALLCLAAVAALAPAAASAEGSPAWGLTVTPMPSNFAPGVTPLPEYLVIATNVGGAETTGEATALKAELPAGLKPVKAVATNTTPGAAIEVSCPTLTQVVTCETTEAIGSGRVFMFQVSVEVTASVGTTLDMHASVSGGGGGEASTTLTTPVQTGPVDFEFLSGTHAPITNADGSPTVLAGSHPFQQTVALGFPTENPGDGLTNAGHAHTLHVELPRGLIGSPVASKFLCTEAQLTTNACPRESQIGIFDATTVVGGVGANGISSTALYNMVPPPGSPAEIATNVATAGLFVHILASVRTASDYGISATVPDILAFGQQPIFSAQSQLWGTPSAEEHDPVRGTCLEVGGPPCGIEDAPPLLTMPADCPGTPLRLRVHTDTWEEPAPAFPEHEVTYENASLSGTPAPIKDCGAEPFDPSIAAHPDTTLTDSPAGLDFNLHLNQEEVGGRAAAPLKDALVSFPEGLTANPAQAAGLGACSETQIGFTGKDAEGPHFSDQPQSCPADSKIGTVVATTPALVVRKEDHSIEEAEGKPVLETLHGSLYLAQPFVNPFNSLIATYIAIEDEKTGIVAKLAGEAILDTASDSGKITVSFAHNPELPLEDVRVHVFGGPRGAFITPPTCGTHTTTSQLTPWSAPEGKVASADASFSLTSSPLGGACPTSAAGLPLAPSLVAGSQSPEAGKYSPLLFKLSRPDGTQRISRIETSMPTGLVAKLAGVASCSEADIAKAKSREAPQHGVEEQAHPSCPAASEIGTVIGTAGAGPNPYRTTGHAYLAGPYKGAPLSAVAIVPAVAGPFDLGAVVSRIALYLDPETARVRAVSDPLPQTLDGVALDLRSVSLRADRPEFARNPTSCAEKAFEGNVVSPLGTATPISERFQLGGCSSLPFKPALSLRLFGPPNRGAHPRLRAVLTAKPGEAGIARTVVTLPRSEFIDQGHFRTICTRVQFAASQCPAGSVYGKVTAYTPLLDYPLQGPVYLRSSSFKLPDLVFALRGPTYQPLEFDAVGHVDSLKGRLRTTFPSVPDAPITKLVLNMQGAKKGLFQNSTNICRGNHRVELKMVGQNGKAHDAKPPLKAQCKPAKKKPKKGHRHR
jgi:hypothetical protein